MWEYLPLPRLYRSTPLPSGWWTHRCDVTNCKQTAFVKKDRSELMFSSCFCPATVTPFLFGPLYNFEATHVVNHGDNENHKHTNPLTSNQICPGFNKSCESSTFRWASFASWCLTRRHSQREVGVIFILQHYSTDNGAKFRWNRRFGRAT